MKRRRTVEGITKYAAKDMQENHLQSSLHLCLYNNHIVATPHKFVEHGRQERTEVLQSLFESHKNESVTKHSNNSFTITSPCSKFYPFGHTSLQASNFAAGKVNTAHDGA